MGVIVVVIGFDANTKLSSGSIGATGVTPLSCPSCPKSPQAYFGGSVGSAASLSTLQEFRVLHFNTLAGAGLWRSTYATELADKVLLVDGDDDS